jgi:hypothetical protein
MVGGFCVREEQSSVLPWSIQCLKRQKKEKNTFTWLSARSSPRRGGSLSDWFSFTNQDSVEAISMERQEQKKWDPNCPKCQEELRRLLELSQAVYDDVDHGAVLYRMPLPDCSNHESEHVS